ncbi:WecB/TagA/CpsF family glycosyltransferase [Methylobacterium gnaphalii]|uniref:Acetyl-mannosamine transferase n=1 Tax=Methylobacterium gnaphalii TaxID=1010610 RepID=A0A512JGA3_9HYPH|nr:WecB/TagA/CpsF family glycosyltransferase [Methylobacterium gnaphalii]GEP08985.1 acetyl-mannosamine transferase [Methylobacterium gnaphalii]GJD67528.1 N-acetylglucosaminyldiphosphoundecaprenol N-acetyl-beta-D-mannosaminyltransferase [Methylobacterium gnaphalii]GLS51417.1 acetyl-mannosamine transferase [Methylobacterium gnaphalii]
MSVRLFGTTFTTASAGDVIDAAAALPRTCPRLIVTANVDHIVILAENAAFRKAYDGAAMRTLDGMPLVWLARISGARNVRRITGHDLIAAALTAPQPSGRRVFVIGSSDLVGARAAAAFVAAGLPADAVASTTPPFGFEEDEPYSLRLAAEISAHGTTLLILGVGAPKSEIWVDRYGPELGDPVTLAVGEALNVATGLVPRAPALMQRLCLEWFFRFLHAPRRLFPRYFLRSWRFLKIAAASRGRDSIDSALGRQGRTASWSPRA